MNGIYLHIPFCKKKCIYCDFFSKVKGLGTIDKYVSALCSELHRRRDYLPSPEVSTLYIGGGTPSLLSPEQLKRILAIVHSDFILNANAEVTIEANPDDIRETFVLGLEETAVNRISLGVQSFDDKMLKLLNRRHNSKQAVDALGLLAGYGYENISIDLIYGLPGQTLRQWESDVELAMSLPITHLSCYALTYEEGTPLKGMLDAGQICEVDEELSRAMYMMLLDKMESQGWDHYEISNFCRPGYRGKHNSGYWNGMCYLGCGPSAHSYNGVSRCWNVRQIDAYVQSGGGQETVQEEEYLTDDMRWDETVMVSLRTREGLDLETFSSVFGDSATRVLLDSAKQWLNKGDLILVDNHLKLSRQGLFVSDAIIVDLMKD